MLVVVVSVVVLVAKNKNIRFFFESHDFLKIVFWIATCEIFSIPFLSYLVENNEKAPEEIPTARIHPIPRY